MLTIKTIVLYLFLFLNFPANNFVSQKEPTLNGKVIKIIDGDTFDVSTDEQTTIRVRMNGIDCPERRQNYYQVCKDALGKYIFGKNVQLITFGKDRYQRTIADVFYKKENINLTMIKNGFAWHYKKYSSDAEMTKAEIKARAAKIGLWEMNNAIAPWNFRKLKSKKLKTLT